MTHHVLLTGGAGFIGHHTIEHILRNTDWNVTVIDRLTYAGDINRLTDITCWPESRHRVKFVYHDFRAPLLTKKIYFAGFGVPDYIIHMGAESHVDRSIAEPMPFAESNVIGTVNMLQFAKAVGVQKFIYVSTDEVYGPALFDGAGRIGLHKEGEPHRPGNPYSASKAAAEDFCYAFWNTYDVPVVISNTMNNFGERQDIEKFVPKTMRSILAGEPVTIHVKKDEAGNVVDVSSRCWLHARNHADALLFLLEHGKPGERYNVTGELRDVNEMALLIHKYILEWQAQKGLSIVNSPLKEDFVDFHSFRKGHDMHYGLDGTKMALLGWKPPYALPMSLQRTVEWTLEHLEWIEL